ncbi:MAG: hypothetical protein ACFE8L_05185 [Candidatus Hodarchaeota archaeon]
MEIIEAIYIINGENQLIFSYEGLNDRADNFDYSNITRFFSVIKTFALKIGEKEAKIIELGNSKIFKTLDDEYNIEVILKCNKNVKEKKASINLTKVLNYFINSFIGYFNSSTQEKKERIEYFIKEISFMLSKRGKMNYFLENIKIFP